MPLTREEQIKELDKMIDGLVEQNTADVLIAALELHRQELIKKGKDEQRKNNVG